MHQSRGVLTVQAEQGDYARAGTLYFLLKSTVNPKLLKIKANYKKNYHHSQKIVTIIKRSNKLSDMYTIGTQ